MPGKSALVAEGVGYILDSDVGRIRKQRPEADAGKSGDGTIGVHIPAKQAKYGGHNSPTAVVAMGTGAATALGDQLADWCQTARTAVGGTHKPRGRRQPHPARSQGRCWWGGNRPSQLSNPRREGPRSAAKWSAPLETKFLRFATRQEKDTVLSRAP